LVLFELFEKKLEGTEELRQRWRVFEIL